MELKSTCKIKLDKGNTQRVKCYKFLQTDFDREFAIHSDPDKKIITNITDTKTGMRLCSIPKEVSKVNATDIDLSINECIKHYTFETIVEKFKELDSLKEIK